MNKYLFLLVYVLLFNVYAANISSEEQNSNTNSISINKNLEKGKSKSITKQKSISIGKDMTKNKSSSISSNIQINKTKQKSITVSNTMSVKKSISIPATQLMPEIDYLVVDKVLNKLIVNDKLFVNTLPIKRSQIPSNLIRIPILAQYNVVDSGQELIAGIQRSLIYYLVKWNQNEIFSYLNNYFINYNFRITTTAGLKNTITNCISASYMQPNLSKFGLCDYTLGASYWAIIGGDVRGRMEFSFDGAILTPFNLISSKYKFFIYYDPNKNIFEFVYKNRKIIYLSSSEIAHFYGDLVFIDNYDTNNILVIDQKVDANGLYLNKVNQHQGFDDYFKKLMYLYFQAFKHLKNKKYSSPEIKFLIRKYIYETTTGKKDFLYQYLHNPTDFWRPSKQTLLKYPTIKTACNDVIYSKKDGVILNNKIVFSVETISSIDNRFSQLFSNSKTRQYARTINKTINFYKRQNKQFAANLVESLAVKFAQSNNFNTKKDLIIKANTSTDVLKNLISIVK